jgi:hypothetical protein
MVRPLGHGAVAGARDGGDRLAAAAGERRCGGGSRRASPNAKAAGWAAAHQRRDSPANPGRLRRDSLHVQRFLGELRAHARSPSEAGRLGAPKACHLYK